MINLKLAKNLLVKFRKGALPNTLLSVTSDRWRPYKGESKNCPKKEDLLSYAMTNDCAITSL